MTIAKIAIIVGASVVTAGSSAAAATRDKWWPKEKDDNASSVTVASPESPSGPEQPGVGVGG